MNIGSIDNKETYKVKTLMSNGKTRFQFYDKESKLLVKMIDEKGRESYYNEYKAVDGIKFSHSSKLVEQQETLKFIIKEIKINIEVDEKLFEIK